MVMPTQLMEPPQSPAEVETDRLLIFANPIAGRGVGAQIAEQLEAKFLASGREVDCFLKKPADLTDRELGPRAKAIVVIGGDGTLRGVVERLVQADRLAPLLPVPLGTANLVGLHLGIRWKPSDVADQVSEAVARYQVRHLDAARANGQVFLLMAGVGFDAHVIYQVDQWRRGPIQLWDYVLPTAMSFLNYPAVPLRVELDGEEIFPEEDAVAFVGNLAEYGIGFPMLPYARDNDGLLDVCVMPCHNRSDLIQLALLAAAGEHVQAEGVVYRRGRQVRIDSPVPVPVQVDGDPAGTTPLAIDLLPVKVPFIVP
jgi:YegS/Rv2252/BmrU family lipid kinase